MVLHQRKEQLSVLLDWVTVRYRTVWLALGVLAALLAVGGIILWRAQGRERREAQAEIQHAEAMRQEASVYVRDDRLTDLLGKATDKLAEAGENFVQRAYADARTSAIVSQNYSQKLIDIGRGETTTRGEVRFYRIEGDVRIKRAGQFHWEGATSRTLLRLGDQVKTSDGAVAQIIYFDGSITTIKPGSLLEIKELFEETASRQRRVSEKLNFGEVEALTRRQETEGSFHAVETATAVARSAEEAKFQVRSRSGEEEIALFTGKVDVSAGGETLALSEREAVTVRGGKVGGIERLLAPPRLVQPADQKVFTFQDAAQARPTVVWERMEEATRYRLQISSRPLFSEPLIDNDQIRKTSVELSGLTPGSYYWRVAAIDERGRAGPYAQAWKFRISEGRIQAENDDVPPKLEVQDFVQNGPIIIINGRTEPGATLWVDNERVDVDDRGDFSTVVRLRRDGVNRVRLVAQDAEGNETSKMLEAVVESY